eukprot:206843_1
MNMFVDPTRAKEYECAFCLDIYTDPVQIGCEDHIFCKQCIDQLIYTNGDSFCCPLCKVKCTSDDVTRVKFIARQIGELKVKCPNSIANQTFIGNETNKNGLRRSSRLKQKTEIGQKRQRSFDNEDDDINHNKRLKVNKNQSCEWQGSYSDLNNHIETCPLRWISCEYCYISILQRELNEHYDKCPNYPLQCTQCYVGDIDRNHMASHISDRCPMTLISCNECKEEIKRKDKQLHVKNECRESLIECVFYKFGCKDKLKRKDEKNHIENATYTHCHLVQIANNQTKLESDIKSLNKKLNEFKNEIKSLKNENKSLNRKINGLEITIKAKMADFARHYKNAKVVYTDQDRHLYYYDDDKAQVEPLRLNPW